MYDDSKNPGQWEVVGGKTGGKAKSKSQSNKNTGNGTKSGGGGHVPILKVDELVTPLDTKYALLDPQLRAQSKRDALGLPEPKPASKNKPKQTATASKEVVKKKSSSKESSKEKAPRSLPEAIKQISATELNSVMTTVKARFTSLFWLKELTSYLNNHMSVETDPVFSGKPRDYPTNLLSSDLKSIITSTIQSCEDDVLNIFYDQCLITMPSEMNRGAVVCGTKIVLQLISFHKPNLVLAHLARAREILEANESRVPVTLSILWVLAQSAFKDSKVGVQVWMETMLPLLGLKNYGVYVAQIADYLSTKVANTKISTNTLAINDYFKLVEQQATIPANVRREVANFVQALAQPMLTAHGSKMFSPFLRRLVSADTSSRAEISKNLANCLRTDAHSFEIWRKEYRSNLVASSYLLKWISNNDSSFARNSEEFQSTLQHFQSVNEDISPTAKIPQGMNECIQYSDILLGKAQPKKKSSSSSKLKKLNYLLLIALISLVYYDIRVHGNGQWADSRLGQAADRSGLTAKAMELRAHPYVAQAEDRLFILRDLIYVKGGELHQRAQPYLNQAAEGLVQLRDVVYRKGEELYPGIWAEADKKYQVALVALKEQSFIIYSKGSQYAELGMDVACKNWAKFMDWSAVYRQQLSVHAENAVQLSGVYYQRARQLTAEFIEKEEVQHALKYTSDMYHKALHAVGLCSH